VLISVSKDEKWHIAWMGNKLKQTLQKDPAAAQRAQEMMERYRQIDKEVYAELLAREREVFGDNLDAPVLESREIDAVALVRSGSELPV